jgi:alpha-tubulin suppressor-like RCC1 family protein
MPRNYLAAGGNGSYDLGLGDATQRNSHTAISGDWLVIKSSSASYAKWAIGIKADGTLWGVGDNGVKQLGGLANASYTTWTQIGTDTDWVDVALGDWHLIALKSSGVAWACGKNDLGQCGTGSGSSQINSLTLVSGSHLFKSVHACAANSGGIKTDDTLKTWGENGTYGKCGVGNTTTSYNTPQSVTLATTCAKLAIGPYSTMAVLTDGRLYSWGYGGLGTLGNGSTSNHTSPYQVGSGTNWQSVSAGASTSYAIKTDGTAWASGDGTYYATAQGSTAQLDSFTQIGSATDWAEAAGGFLSLMLRKTSGSLWVIGYNATGCLGTNGTSDITTLGDLEATYGRSFPSGTRSISMFNGTSYVVVSYSIVDLAGAAADVATASATLTGGHLAVPLAGAAADVATASATLTGGHLAVPLAGAAVDVATASATLTGGHLAVPLAGAAVDVASASATLTAGPVVSIPTSLTVSYPVGTVSIPTELSVTETGLITIPTQLAVITAGDVALWTARCIINGVDVSASLEGSASVTAEEGAARIASVVINPPSGTVAPLDYVGKSIVIDYVPVIGGTAVPLRLFTGVIDTPTYDPDTRLLRLECVDDMQNRVAVLDRSVIDSIIGGRYTDAVQGVLADNWDYAKALLSTVPASLDAGPSGGLRVTPWQIATSWATYDETALLYQRSAVTYPQRSTLVNSVAVEFDYRYPRLRQRYTTLGWSGTHIDMAPCGWQYPKQQDIEGAANGSGWKVTLGIYYPAPAAIPHSSGGFIHPDDGAIDMAIIYLTQRHSQTVTEKYRLTVAATESVTANGTLPGSVRGALASAFDGLAWESALDVAPLMPDGGEQDYSPDATRSDADYALQTLLDQANVKILGSHRGARVTNAVLCNPALDLDKRVTISTADMSVSGKIAAVTHTLDFASGSAISEFSIACFGAGGAGIITPDTLDPPAAPAAAAATHDWAAETPSLFVQTYGVTAYSDSLMGLLLNPPETIFVEDVPSIGSKSYPNPYYVAGSYPVTGFRVQMPGVDDADRNPLDKPVSGSYAVLIPSDTLTFTVP